ncbi:MAG: ROK family protein [Simkania sp.]|nr:ROK family protein [Simkania sp.]
MHILGIDIGGTKITACLGDGTGKILASKRILTQPLGGSKNGVEATFDLIQQVLKDSEVDIAHVQAIGISSPGPIDYKAGKMLTPPNLKGWENTELVRLFREAFKKPVFMNNDANAAAIAEYEFGGCKGIPNLIYLTLSTGMGGGVIIDGTLLQGASDTAGEVGHYVLDIHGPFCPCGLRGCFEVYCGGANLAKMLQKKIKHEQVHTQILKEAGGNIDTIGANHLIEAVKKNDAFALSIWEDFIERLAQGIGVILMCFNPEAIVLGTMAIHAQDLLLTPLIKTLPKYAWKQPIGACRIEASILGSQISELSALALAISGLKGHA